MTSWGDNRIELYKPYHQGGQVKATRQVAVLGDAMFRPVDMAVDKQGSLYLTDWVDRSYNVHRKGRIWKLSFEPAVAPGITLPPSAEELAFKQVREPKSELEQLVRDRWTWLCSPKADNDKTKCVAAIKKALDSEDSDVRLVAIRWAAETGNKQFLPLIESQWNRSGLNSRMVAAIAASLSYLEMGRVESGGFDRLTYERLVAFVKDANKPADVRAHALRLVPPDAAQWTVPMLVELVTTEKGNLQKEAARHLAVLATNHAVAKEAAKSLLDDASLPERVKQDLQIAFGELEPSKQPQPTDVANTDVDAWMKQVGTGGDAQRGWRVFFDPAGAKCSSCHMHDGRGARVGPDLTTLGGTTDRRRVLESILHPSREIGPMYTTWKVLTTDGRTIVGIKLNGGGVGQSSRYLLADSTTVDVPLEQIDVQELSDVSIMPEGLAQRLTITELQDLLAYLTQPNE